MVHEFPKALKEGTIFSYNGSKWVYAGGGISLMTELEFTFAAAPKARKKKVVNDK